MKDLYEVLGVAKDATKDAIKKAYRKKAKEKHPDRDGGDNDAMSKVNQAYAVLSDDQKRADYDKTGQDKPLPSIEERAMQSLAKAFDDMLSDEAPQGDVVDIISGGISSAIRALEIDQKKTELYLKRLEKKAAKVKRKVNGGVDLWANVVAARRQRYENSLATLKLNIEIAKKAQEILSEYVHEWDEEPPKQRKTGHTSGLFADWGPTA